MRVPRAKQTWFPPPPHHQHHHCADASFLVTEVAATAPAVTPIALKRLRRERLSFCVSAMEPNENERPAVAIDLPFQHGSHNALRGASTAAAQCLPAGRSPDLPEV